MRLIDADEVIRDLASLKYSKEYGKVGATYNLAIDDCIGEIKATPTALYAEPVKHAHWIPDERETGEGSNTYKCSACGEIQMLIEGTPKENGWKYCPNCGAKMDEEEENNHE